MLRFLTVLTVSFAVAAGASLPAIDLPDPFDKPGDVLRICCYSKETAEMLDSYYPDYQTVRDFKEDSEGIFTGSGRIGETEVAITIIEDREGTYQEYLDSMLLHGEDTPADDCIDLFMVGGSDASKYFSAEADVTLPLEDFMDPEDAENQYPCMRAAASDHEGRQRASGWGVSCGAFVYRRSYAREAFGTDDPSEIGKMASSWESVTKMAETLKRHGRMIFAGPAETFDSFLSVGAWVDENGTITIDENASEWVQCMSEYVKAGYTGNARRLSSGWKRALEPESDVFAFLMTPDEADEFLAAEGTDPESTAYGDWAVCVGPAPFVRGGDFIAASRETDNRELAADIIRTLTCDEEVLKKYALASGGAVNHMRVMEDLAGDSSFENPVFGGQNAAAVFSAAAGKISNTSGSPYDNSLKTIFLEAFLPFLEGRMEEGDALSQFYEAALERYPFLADR